MFFCFIFLHRETILIHLIQISRSNFLTFRFHLICFLMLSTFKQAVTSQDAMIPRELMPIRGKKCTHKGFVICIFWKTFKLRKNIPIRNIQFAQEYSNQNYSNCAIDEMASQRSLLRKFAENKLFTFLLLHHTPQTLTT